MMIRPIRSSFACLLVAGLLVGPASILAADKKDKDKKPDKSQSDAARDVLEKQKDIAQQLRDKKADSPDETQKKIDDLQKKIDSLNKKLAEENSDYASDSEKLQKSLKSANEAGDKKKIEKAEKSIEKRNEQHKDKLADLNKDIADYQAKIDALKPPATDTKTPPPAK